MAARFMPGSSGARRRIRVNPGVYKHAQAQQRAHRNQFGPESAFDREQRLRRWKPGLQIRDAFGALNITEGPYRYLQATGTPRGISTYRAMKPSDYGATTPGAADDRWVGAPIYQDPGVFTASYDQALRNMMGMAAAPFQPRGGLPPNILNALFGGGGGGAGAGPAAKKKMREEMQEAGVKGRAAGKGQVNPAEDPFFDLKPQGQLNVDPDPFEPRPVILQSHSRPAARNQGLPYGSGYGPGTYGGSYII